MADFPVPDGKTREYMRSFGDYPIYLINSDLHTRATSTNDLFPVHCEGSASALTNPAAGRGTLLLPTGITSQANTNNTNHSMTITNDADLFSEEFEDGQTDGAKIANWNVARTAQWLDGKGFGEYKDKFAENQVDGRMLVHITDQFLRYVMCVIYVECNVLRRM